MPIYILDPSDPWGPRGAAIWALREALKDLGQNLQKSGVDLILRKGDPLTVLRKLMKETGATRLVFSRLYEPYARERDKKIEEKLATLLEVESFKGSLLFEPWEIQTKTGGPYKVYSPFAKACFAKAVLPPLPAPKKMSGIEGLDTEPLNRLLPEKAWMKKMAAHWDLGESVAQKKMQAFREEGLSSYQSKRDRPDFDGTSRLSPFLHFGLLSPRWVWHIAKAAIPTSETFLRQLLWREFSFHLLYHFPDLPEKPLQSAFEKMPWRKDEAGFAAWKQGRTGYPIVDAGMRQLWQTGWMHNRVRMIVASFLVKDLLLPWQAGQMWFWETLLDADLANNAASWQWVAGCGADAAPYFRVFNPVLQGKKFDPDGAYVRRYVIELKDIKGPLVHEPWRRDVKTYSRPIVNHASARVQALAALKKTKKP